MAIADINNVLEIGRVTRDAELKYTNGGMAILAGSIAVNHRGNKDGAQESSFFDFKLFGKFAETMAPFMVKGQQVALKGYLKQQRWKDNEGQNHSRIEIIADELELLGGKKQEQGGSGYNSGDGYGDYGNDPNYGFGN